MWSGISGGAGVFVRVYIEGSVVVVYTVSILVVDGNERCQGRDQRLMIGLLDVVLEHYTHVSREAWEPSQIALVRVHTHTKR